MVGSLYWTEQMVPLVEIMSDYVQSHVYKCNSNEELSSYEAAVKTFFTTDSTLHLTTKRVLQ